MDRLVTRIQELHQVIHALKAMLFDLSLLLLFILEVGKMVGAACQSKRKAVFGGTGNKRRESKMTFARRLPLVAGPFIIGILVLQDFGPGWRRCERGMDQSDVRVSLREISPHPGLGRIEIFREES
jgi:hypothetical protein